MRTSCFALASVFLSSIAVAQPASPPDHYTLVRCGSVLAMPGNEPLKNSTVVVKNGLVDRIVSGFDGPDLNDARQHGAKIDEVNLRESFVLPGLIDCHVHLSNVWDQSVRARFPQETPEFIAVRASAFARATLDAGFTTVRDLGANEPNTILGLRDAINQGIIVGPRILAAGHWIAMTGGHGDNTLGYRADLIPQPGPEKGIADGADECRKAVRAQIKLGADVIKLTATGGVLSASSAGLAQHFTQDELNSIVQTAHSLGRKAAAHAHGVDGINASLRAGCDSIEHATYLNDESIKLFKEHGAYYVPTLLAAKTVADNAKIPGYYLAVVAAKAEKVGPVAMEAFRKAHAAGVKIAFGTDTGVSPHGQNAREFALMVQGGMSPGEAIYSATVSAADLLGISSQVGTLETGKAADLIAVKGDPLKDITELERVQWVMRAGAVARGPAEKPLGK
jgi:imidazolonepropionase-like amidohydrolase